MSLAPLSTREVLHAEPLQTPEPAETGHAEVATGPEPVAIRPGEAPLLDCRTVWVSDLHLGTRSASAQEFLAFVRGMRCERLFIVGDLIDGWQLRRSWYWPRTHNTTIQKLLHLSRKGTKVTYVPGNHDEFFRDFLGLNFGNIAVRCRAYHRTADGRRFLVLHVDELDGVVRHHRGLAALGHVAYNMLLSLNAPLNVFRRRVLRLPHWSLSAHIKRRVKDKVAILSRFE